MINHSHFSTGGPSFIGNKIDTTSYSLELSLPLYLGGFNHARRREAGALAEQAREQLQDQRLTVSRDTRNLFRAVATDVVRVKARLKAIKSSESARMQRRRVTKSAPATLSTYCRRNNVCTAPSSNMRMRATAT
ncbi:MAG: TolC family protein [Pseudomonadales bacterium]